MNYRKLLISLVILFTACEKEIDLDYREVDPIYVAEATVSPQKTRVRITTTRSVDVNSQDGIYVENALVAIQLPDGFEDELTYKGRGVYESSVVSVEGATYNIDINIDGQHYTSASTVLSAPQVSNVRFVWKKVTTERMLFIDLHLQDTPNENNYYFMHLYRNGIGYRWAIMKDSENPGGELTQLFACTTERAMDDGSDSDALKDGDVLKLEIRSLDKASYDYFYSLQLATQSNTNPLPNFTGGMLGYFSAYQDYTRSFVFHRADVEEE